MYDTIMSERVDMDYENAEACGANEPHVDCSDAFNTSQVIMLMFVTDLIKWILVENLNYVDCFVGIWVPRGCFLMGSIHYSWKRICGGDFKVGHKHKY